MMNTGTLTLENAGSSVEHELTSQPDWDAARPPHELKRLADFVREFDHSAQSVEPLGFGSLSGRRIFAFPPLIGYGVLFRALAEVAPEFAIFGFNYLEARERTQVYVDQLEALRFGSDDLLLGYCGGGTLAFQVGCELERRGRRVSALVCLDTPDAWHDGNLPDNPYSRQTRVVDRFLDYLGASDPALAAVLRGRVLARASHYMATIRSRLDTGLGRFNVHLIRTAQFAVSSVEWRNRTSGRVSYYASDAGHNAFFGREHGPATARLIRLVAAAERDGGAD